VAGYGSGLYGRGNYGIDPKEGASVIDAIAALTAAGTGTFNGATSIEGVASVTPSGAIVYLGAVQIDAVGEVTGDGVIYRQSGVNIEASGDLTASGEAVYFVIFRSKLGRLASLWLRPF